MDACGKETKIIMKKTYCYPDNLTASSPFMKYWSITDTAIIFCIVMLSMLLMITLHVWLTFLIAIVYAFLSMKVTKGYSIIKFIVLYVRYLFTDELILKWSGGN